MTERFVLPGDLVKVMGGPAPVWPDTDDRSHAHRICDVSDDVLMIVIANCATPSVRPYVLVTTGYVVGWVAETRLRRVNAV